MPTYITTAKLAEQSGVDIVTIRDLEERGILKAAPGREKFRKRWQKTAAYDLRRALVLYPRTTRPNPFNAVLPPGALSAASQQLKPEERVTITSIEEAMDRFQKRTAAVTLSEKSARDIAEAWIELRPGSKNELSALTKVMERINKNKTGNKRKQAAQSIRAYLVHLGLVERAPGGKNRRVVPPRPAPTRTRRVFKNGHDAPTTPAPTMAGMELDDFEAVLPLLKAAAELSAAQRAFIIAWLKQRA